MDKKRTLEGGFIFKSPETLIVLYATSIKEHVPISTASIVVDPPAGT